ncbi:MAG: sigma 54-interacting transcriptional regulator [Pseudomonadota bacterium]
MIRLDIEDFKTVFGFLEEGVVISDKDRRIRFLNRAAERITGHSAEQVVGRKCYDVFQSDLCHSDCKLLKAMESGEEIVAPTVMLKNGRGELVYIRGVTTPLGEDGNFKAVAQIISDVTEIVSLRRHVVGSYAEPSFITGTPQLLQMLEMIPDLAASDVPVLILGETGTGKEVLAREIHYQSRRKGARFVRVNCGALPDTLLEAELFGTVAGAYTDAKKARKGRLELAEGGTVFLDEIGDMTRATQVKVLRVLQEKTYEPLGTSRTRRADVRFISATNQNLAEMVEKGEFRKDLYYRINTMVLPIPPLRNRREDVPRLVSHFLKKHGFLTGKDIRTVDQEVMDILMHASWPGNVRQLEHVIEHAFVLAKGQELSVHHLPAEFRPDLKLQSDVADGAPASVDTVRSAEKQAIIACLRRHHWNKVLVSVELGISRSTLWRKMKSHRIPLSPFGL